ncbi:type III PLP-dependent enzyme [Microbacterium sp.]|uniref:type III PLP-dependent enzyme n=1 Tax=Microbacterium sp. TaxID=51671 RepID=UPI003221D89C
MNTLRARREAEIATLFRDEGVQRAMELHGTPLLLLEPGRVRAQYRRLRAALPFAEVYYAVKALDHTAVIDTLAQEGCGFDVASIEELDRVRARGVPVDRTLFTHPVKKPAEIAEAWDRGVQLFVADNPVELDKLAASAPTAQVLLRLSYPNPEAKSDLSAKFGIEPSQTRALIGHAMRRGLHVVGFSFHVGSQLDAPRRFADAVGRTLELMDELEATTDVRFEVLDVGGGFPVAYDAPVTSVEEIADAIRPLLAPRAGRLRILVEPGRLLAAEAMSLVTSVTGRAERGGRRWVYVDDGVYGAYSNVVAEDVHPMILPAPGPLVARARLAPTTVAGPTCDSADIVARDVPLPPLSVGDLLVSPAMGAYTIVTATTFNGRVATPIAVVAEPADVSPEARDDAAPVRMLSTAAS